jgi:hypothetical protein
MIEDKIYKLKVKYKKDKVQIEIKYIKKKFINEKRQGRNVWNH